MAPQRIFPSRFFLALRSSMRLAFFFLILRNDVVFNSPVIGF